MIMDLPIFGSQIYLLSYQVIFYFEYLYFT
jgi:hypothetical protein